MAVREESMCGICGKISLDPEKPVETQLIRRMTQALLHRGPEEEGSYFRRLEAPFLSVGLGHRRLKIIDLSQNAHQPLSNETGKIQVVFNGEIYNYRALRKELIEKGHPFRSQSDTEVLVHLYEEEGPDFVRHLDGMFAFALWDEEKRRLLLARDPMGKKPLFYTETEQGLVFASELKAILEDPSFKRDIDPQAIDDYLSLGYVPAPGAVFKNVQKLLPGHLLIYESGHVAAVPYWNLEAKQKADLSQEKAKEKLVALLEEATRKRLVSDVPLGVFLSGGIDSSAVVAMMRRLLPQEKIRTFSIGFEEFGYDERPFARLVSEKFKTEHREFLVKPDLLEVLPKMVWHLDEPFADSSALATFYLADRTRQEVTVALNGDGGDELFGGYERYVALQLSDWIRKRHLALPARWISSLAGRIDGQAERSRFPQRLKRFGLSLSKETGERYLDWVGLLKKEERDSLYIPLFRERISLDHSLLYLKENYRHFPANGATQTTPLIDMLTYLPNDLLVKADRMTMAHALEGRSPFLDRDLVAFAASLPFSYKVRGLTTKYLLKEALRPFLPDEILRRRKQGFGVPVGLWFRGELRETLQETLGPRFLERGLFRKEAIGSLIQRHLCGKEDGGQRLWALFMLELWYRRFVDGEVERRSRKAIGRLRSGNPMKVMRIITRFNIGGPAIHAALLNEGLEKEGIQNVLVTGRLGKGEGDMSYLLSEKGASQIVLPELRRDIHPLLDLVCLWKLFRTMRRERPDIVHTHMAKAGTLGRLAALFAGVPIKIHTFHGHVFEGYFPSMTTRFFLKVERFLAKRSQGLIAVSDHVRDEICQRYHIDLKDRVRTIPVGLDLDPFLQVNDKRGRLQDELHVSSSIRLIGIVGRLVPIKNHPFFLDIAEMLVKRYRDLHFVIVGSGEEEPFLRNLVRQKGLSSFVAFLGWRRDLADIYADLDLVVLTSRNEGTPVSLIEAMASGKAIVAARVGGVPDVVQDGVTGYTVALDDLSDFVEKIERLLVDPGLRAQFGQEGRQWVKERFSKERLLQDIQALYEELCDRRAKE